MLKPNHPKEGRRGKMEEWKTQGINRKQIIKW